jgi:hypothetical protein
MEMTDECGVGLTPSVRRMGLIAYRMAMILSVLRLDPHGQMPSTIVCHDTDFSFALDTVDILLGHVADIYAELPAIEEEVEDDLMPIEINFLNALPNEFNNNIYLKIASDFYINKRTAYRYIDNLIKAPGGCLNKPIYLSYITKKQFFTYNDTIQLGVLPGLVDESNNFIADNSALVCSKPFLIKNSRNIIDKFYVKIKDSFKQALFYNNVIKR